MTTQLPLPENALTVKEEQPFTALCFTTQATLRTLSDYAPNVAMDLYREAERLNLTITGPIYWLYTDVNGDENHEFQLEIALPVSQPKGYSNAFVFKDFPSFRCATYTFEGPWSEFMPLYDKLFGLFYRNGYQNDGRVREVYTTIDLENPANCVTDIQIGIA